MIPGVTKRPQAPSSNLRFRSAGNEPGTPGSSEAVAQAVADANGAATRATAAAVRVRAAADRALQASRASGAPAGAAQAAETAARAADEAGLTATKVVALAADVATAAQEASAATSPEATVTAGTRAREQADSAVSAARRLDTLVTEAEAQATLAGSGTSGGTGSTPGGSSSTPRPIYRLRVEGIPPAMAPGASVYGVPYSLPGGPAGPDGDTAQGASAGTPVAGPQAAATGSPPVIQLPQGTVPLRVELFVRVGAEGPLAGTPDAGLYSATATADAFATQPDGSLLQVVQWSSFRHQGLQGTQPPASPPAQPSSAWPIVIGLAAAAGIAYVAYTQLAPRDNPGSKGHGHSDCGGDCGKACCGGKKKPRRGRR